MSELQTGRYDQLMRRVGDLKGPGSKVSEVLEEVFPVLELEGAPPELLALTGWRTAWQSTTRPAQGAMQSASQLRNPADSGVLVAITQFGIEANAANIVQVEVSTTLFGTPVSGLFRDSRFGVPRATIAQVSSVDGVAVGGGLRLQMAGQVQQYIRDDNGICVLTPGTALNIGTTTNNVLLTVNYFWRERLAEPSEINF